MGVGRFFCVLVPFALAIGSLVFLLIAALGGVANKDLYMFRVNVTNLSIDPAAVILDSAVTKIGTRDVDFGSYHDTRLLHTGKAAAQASDVQTTNITAGKLGLANIYDVALWGYCSTNQAGEKTCTQAKLDWASSALNTTFLEEFGTAAGVKIDLPDEITTAIQAFNTISRWTQIVYIIAFVTLGLEIIFGIFANCTRVMSCITWLVAGIASAAVCGAAALSTAQSVVVVGALETTGKLYGAGASFNTTFLALVWIAAALALAAGFFWLFTICCCAPDHRRSSKKDRHRGSTDAEKLLPTGAYQPLNEGGSGFYNQNAQYGAPRYPSGARSDLAYEPYSHRS